MLDTKYHGIKVMIYIVSMYIIIMDAIFIAGMQGRVSAWIPLNWFL